MKHYVLALSLLFVAGTAFGQKANVKTAKSALGDENPNFDEAFTAINAAMQDPTTKDDPETYDIAGKLYKKVYETEALKAAGGNAYDTVKLYNGALEMFKYFQICDEKAQLPDEKGKVRKNKWREDKVLLERNKYIAEIYQDFIDNRNDKNFARVLVANFLLEGLYFYNGFNFFYNLAARSLMIGTADEIKYINRDELTHCVIFANIIKEIRQERHDFFNDDEIYEMFAKATEQEINWSNHIIGNRVMGITPETIEQYTKFMANKRLKEIGMQPLFEGFDSNPYKQLENIADTNGAGSVKGNFFEANVSSYNQSTAIEGWEEI